MVRCSFQGIHLLNTVNDVLTLFVSAMSWYSTRQKTADETVRSQAGVPAATAVPQPRRCMSGGLRDGAARPFGRAPGARRRAGAGDAGREGAVPRAHGEAQRSVCRPGRRLRAPTHLAFALSLLVDLDRQCWACVAGAQWTNRADGGAAARAGTAEVPSWRLIFTPGPHASQARRMVVPPGAGALVISAGGAGRGGRKCRSALQEIGRASCRERV